MKLLYNAQHPYKGRGGPWGYKEYQAVADSLPGYRGCTAVDIHDNGLKIEILSKKMKRKTMPPGMRIYLWYRGLKISKVKE